MPKLEGFDKIHIRLEERKRRVSGGATPTVRTGYEAEYAVHVHEDRQAHHPIGKAGFLIDPFRRLRAELRKQIADDLRKGIPLKTALLRAGVKVQYYSEMEVPVLTGFLKSTAFTKVE